MKAMVARAYGPPDRVLEFDDVATPEPAPGEVVVRVRATSANPADWHLIRGEPRIARLQFGLRRPRWPVLGCDVAGEVHALGGGVAAFRPGDAVYGSPFMAGFGAFAEFVRLPTDRLVPMPAGLSVEQAAAVPMAGTTALQAVRDHGRLQAGQRVLLIGAAGGVGTFAVQIAKALGAEVTAVCSTAKVDLVASLGADHVVDRTNDDVTRLPGGYDLVVHVSGTQRPSALRRLLTTRGTLVQMSGDSPGRWVGALGRMVAGAVTSPFVGQTLTTFTVAPNAADLATLTGLVEAGTVTPVVDRALPLVEVAAALRHLEQGRARGKVVVTV